VLKLFISILLTNQYSTTYEIKPIEVVSKYPESILSSKSTSYFIDSLLLSTFSYDPSFLNLSYIPSITLTKYGLPGFLHTAGIRGFFSKRTEIYMEGFKLNSRSSSSFNLSYLSSIPLKGIEVLSSSGSSIYGENALSGIINLRINKKQGFYLKGGAANYKTTIFSSSFGMPFTILSYSNYTSIPFEKNRDVHLSKFTVFSESERFNSLFLYSSNITGNPVSQTARQEDKLLLTGVKFKSKKLYLGYQFKEERVFYKEPAFNIENNNKIQNHRIFGDLAISLPGFNLRTGFEFEGEKLKSLKKDSLFIDKKDQRFYPYFSIELGRQNFIPYFEGGKEITTTSKFKGPFVYRTGVLIKKENFSMFFNYTKGFKAPDLFDLYWPEDMYSKGNPNLKPEKSIEWETGFRFLTKALNFNLSYFNRKLKEGIIWDSDENFLFTPQNLEFIETSGIEGKLGIRKEGHIMETAFLVFTKREYKIGEKNTVLKHVPTYQGSILIGESIDNFSFFYRARFIGPHFSNDPITFSTINIKSVVLNDFSLKLSLNPYFSVSVIIENFDNKKYEFIKGYPFERRRTFVFIEASI
jgi:outer membrane cobalamin receptor